MSIAYKEMTASELKLERARLIYILQNHPKPIAYKQAKRSLERVNKLLVDRLLEGR